MRLSDCFIPVLATVRQFQRAPAGDAAALAAQLDPLIADARNKARDAGFTDANIEAAWFAVAAWVDESLLALDWHDTIEWQRRLLQKRYFNTASAGVEFFSRLESLNVGQLAVREVYYLCLAMGFAGRYGYDRNQKALEDIKRQNLQLLLQGDDGMPGEAGRLLFPDGYAAGSPLSGAQKRGNLRRWRLSALTLSTLVLPLVALIALYGIYHAVIWQMVNTILPQTR
ncbi:MAG TPA: DotU family type IV/VI secretion system protein [Burkholderiaceae bacterium]|nr:DotU family type IV/VI secretion system protein [Burkholderiaceae bacterium]